MLLIELPRALEEYFAYAETDPTRKGRRFSITLPFYSGERLDRLQWWYHVSPAEEEMYDGKGVSILKARATERFSRHIQRWLANTNQRLHGDDAIPRITSLNKSVAPPIVKMQSEPELLEVPALREVANA